MASDKLRMQHRKVKRETKGMLMKYLLPCTFCEMRVPTAPWNGVQRLGCNMGASTGAILFDIRNHLGRVPEGTSETGSCAEQ